MKKGLLIAAFIFVTGVSGLFAQQFVVNPIPSYNFEITGQTTAFREKNATNTREKREMDVVISSSSTASFPIYATVWISKNSNSVILGPFTIHPDEQLSVPIDGSKWTVLINCNWSITASVWTE